MITFVDTSALFAFLDADDTGHDRVRHRMDEARSSGIVMTHNYVVVESVSLVQGRLGMPAVHALRDEVIPAIAIGWVDEVLHAAAMDALLAEGRRRVSLVDHVSFAFMRREGVVRAIALDRHFARAGFEVVP